MKCSRTSSGPTWGSDGADCSREGREGGQPSRGNSSTLRMRPDRKSTRLNSSHSQISYAVFCLKKKKHATATNITGWLTVDCSGLNAGGGDPAITDGLSTLTYSVNLRLSLERIACSTYCRPAW